MNLCKDCRWYKPQGLGLMPKCYHPETAEVSRVDGSLDRYSCEFNRGKFNSKCGLAGKLWEPRDKPWWKIWG